MQFHIDIDSQELVAGWLIPDNPNTIPTFLISSPERSLVKLSANVPRPDIKELGQHNTGMVGFAIDQAIFPGLGELDDFQIQEEDTGVLIYRRGKGVPQRVFCFDLATSPPHTLAQASQKHFALCYGQIEQHPYDTLFSILNNQASTSMFAAGRPLLTRHENTLRRNNFALLALLRHPHEDLAQRLLKARETAPHDQDSENTEPFVSLARSVALEQPAALAAALTTIADVQPAAIVNPFVRTLACTLDDRPAQQHVAVALNNLATMDLVGSLTRFGEFKTTLAEMLGEDVLKEFTPQTSGELNDLARRLAGLPIVKKFLALDLSLYSYVEQAMETAAVQ